MKTNYRFHNSISPEERILLRLHRAGSRLFGSDILATMAALLLFLLAAGLSG
jgi:hypothetical protein